MIENTDRQCEFNKIFMEVAEKMAKMSTCLRRQTGAVLVKDNRIISTGYNGAPSKYPHCKECLRIKKNIESGKSLELCIAVHAEINAILMCAKNGISTKDTILYCIVSPCNLCLGQLINAGVKAIVFKEIYGNNYILNTVKADIIELYVYNDGFVSLYNKI